MTNFIFENKSTGLKVPIEEVCSEKEARYFLYKQHGGEEIDWKLI